MNLKELEGRYYVVCGDCISYQYQYQFLKEEAESDQLRISESQLEVENLQSPWRVEVPLTVLVTS